MPDDVKVNAHRLWNNLVELSRIGKTERGISRVAFSPEDMDGKRWLASKLSGAGLNVRIDRVGNVFGRYVPKHLEGMWRPAILIGSHIDTVPEGGMFDGALGVLGGLECILTLKESQAELRHPLELVAFSNEEGSRIGPGLFGSRAFTEGLDRDEWQKIAPVLERAGILDRGENMERLQPSFSSQDYSCYLELHIEQGGVLDKSGIDIGVVQGIVNILSFKATFRGTPNHAGTTPMGDRRDALLGACELALYIPEVVRELGSGTSVGTCGQLSVLPGGRNIIPGEATMSVEIRDLNVEVAYRIVQAIRDEACTLSSRRGLEVELGPVELAPGALMSPAIQDIIEESARRLGLTSKRMPSGAGHDAAIMARYVPAGMIFVPSVGGISHSPHEWTSMEQCAAGANVLLKTIQEVDSVY